MRILSVALCLSILLSLPGQALASPDPSVFVTEDGVELVYWSQGSGDVALVFVHCWACDHEFWKHQLDVFAKGYRVVTMDLAGHGLSGTNREQCSIAGMGQDVAALVEHLGLDRVILIGHSLGGPVSLEAAARMEGRLLGVIAVDTLHDAEQKMTKEQTDGMLAMFRQDYPQAMRQFVGWMFPEGADSTIVDWVVEKGSSGDHETLLAIIGGFGGYDFARAMSTISCPLRAVNAAPRPPFGPPTKTEINRKYANYDVALIEGVGHYLQLEKPGEFNRLLAGFVEELVGRKPD